MCLAELWYPHHSDPHFQSPAQNGTIPPPRVAQKSSRPQLQLVAGDFSDGIRPIIARLGNPYTLQEYPILLQRAG